VVDARLPGDDAVASGEHDGQWHLDRLRCMEPLDDNATGGAGLRSVGARDRGEPGSTDDRRAVGDHPAYGLGVQPRHLAGDHAAQAPPDQ
jgi:hypothetical protein